MNRDFNRQYFEKLGRALEIHGKELDRSKMRERLGGLNTFVRLNESVISKREYDNSKKALLMLRKFL